jgi:hypothetical protein
MNKWLNLVLSLLVMTQFSFAQEHEYEHSISRDGGEGVGVIRDELNHIELDRAADQKILDIIKNSLDDDKKGRIKKSKRKLKHKNFKRNAGKVLSIVSTKMNKPFVVTAGFLRGFFQKSSKNTELYAVSRLLIKHELEIEDVILNGLRNDKGELLKDEDGQIILERVATVEQLEMALSAIIPNILTNKVRNVLVDIIMEAGVNIDVSSVATLSDLLDLFEELEFEEQEAVMKVLMDMDISVINNHEEFKDLVLLSGDLTKDQILSILVDREFNLPKGLDLEEILKKLGLQTAVDLASGIVVGNITSAIIISSISGAIGGIYTTVALSAAAAHAISINACLKKQDLIETDDDFARFCSYVVFASGSELINAKSKGFVAGKDLRLKTEKLIAKIIVKLKEKRENRKAKRAIRKKARAEKKQAKANGEVQVNESIFTKAKNGISKLTKKIKTKYQTLNAKRKLKKQSRKDNKANGVDSNTALQLQFS